MSELSKDDSRKGAKDLIAEAMKILLREKKFSKITVGNICQKSDLSRQSFYRNFFDKYDVFAYLFKTYMDEAMNSYGLMAMPEIGQKGLEFFWEYRNAIKDMGCDFGYPNAFMNFWFDYCAEHYYSVIGKVKITPEVEAAMKFYFHATYFTFYEYVCGNIAADPEETIRIVLNFMPDVLCKTLYIKKQIKPLQNLH